MRERVKDADGQMFPLSTSLFIRDVPNCDVCWYNKIKSSCVIQKYIDNKCSARDWDRIRIT